MLKNFNVVNVGAGNTGMILSSLWQKIHPSSKQILISSAKEDTNSIIENMNIDRNKAILIELKQEGNQKKFTYGEKMWEKYFDKLKAELSFYEDKIVFIWAAMGGGTASSCFKILSECFRHNKNKIFFIGVVPAIEERIPPNANLIMSANMAQDVSLERNVNVILFDRNILDRRFKNDINIVDNYIVETVKMMFNLLEDYSVKGYAPITVDSSELESVYLAEYPGFLAISFDDIKLNKNEQFTFHVNKFKSEASVKNLLVALMVNDTYANEQVEEINNKFNDLLKRYGKRYKIARIIPGIVRTKGEGIRLFVVEHGLYPDKYFQDNKQKALELIQKNRSDLALSFSVENQERDDLII